MADEKGQIFSAKVGDEEWKHTGVLLPRMAGREDIPVEELLDECDVVYKPLQGRNAKPRRELLNGGNFVYEP